MLNNSLACFNHFLLFVDRNLDTIVTLEIMSYSMLINGLVDNCLLFFQNNLFVNQAPIHVCIDVSKMFQNL